MKEEIDIYQVDAFARRPFSGNPAAVCPLQAWLPTDTMQAIAEENNLSETAFFIPQGENFVLRWFTPKVEIDLCGHATLATSHVIFNHLNYPKNEIHFDTCKGAGPLRVLRQDGWLTLDFPSWSVTPIEPPADGIVGLNGTKPKESYSGTRDLLFVYENEADIRRITPNFSALGKLKRYMCVTAPGKDCDFVSRFFCAGDGVEEDPVTGSAHSMLIPYWAQRLDKTKMLARQLSERGGELRCEYLGERVFIGGQAQTYLQGKIFLPDRNEDVQQTHPDRRSPS